MRTRFANSEWLRLLAGLIVVYALFQSVAHLLRSDRGEAGLLIAALVLAGTVLFQRSFFARTFAAAARVLSGWACRRAAASWLLRS